MCPVWKSAICLRGITPGATLGLLDRALQEKSKGRMKIELHIDNSLAEGAHLEG